MWYNLGMAKNDVRIPKKYELLSVDDNGNEIRLYEDGSKRNQRGQLVEFPVEIYNNPIITSDNVHEYHRMRKEKILLSIEKSVMDVTKTKIPAEAVGRIVGKRAEIAMKDKTRVGNEAAKIVLQAIDAYQNKVSADNGVSTMRNEITMDDNTRALLERMFQERRDGVIDVSAEDVDE